MYALAKEYNDDDDFEYKFTDEEMRLFEQHRIKRLNGESKTYDWKEAKNFITCKKNMK
jgi:hypothetical protein